MNLSRFFAQGMLAPQGQLLGIQWEDGRSPDDSDDYENWDSVTVDDSEFIPSVAFINLMSAYNKVAWLHEAAICIEALAPDRRCLYATYSNTWDGVMQFTANHKALLVPPGGMYPEDVFDAANSVLRKTVMTGPVHLWSKKVREETYEYIETTW